MFEIKINKGKVKKVDSEQYAEGSIQIEAFHEDLLFPLGYWKEKDYEDHWRKQVINFIDGNLDRTFLITKMYNPELPITDNSNSTIHWWVLYREGERVFIQWESIVLNELKHRFSFENAFDLISERNVQSIEGFQISEWETSMSSLKDFVK